MSLSLEISQQIIANVIGRHQRQITELNMLLNTADLDPEACFRKLLKLEADLQDIRQGLYAAAYVSISCESDIGDGKGGDQKIGETANADRAKRRFREG